MSSQTWSHICSLDFLNLCLTYCFILNTFSYFKYCPLSLSFPLFLSLHVLRSYFISRRDHRVLAFSWFLVWYLVTCYSAFSSLYMDLYCEECKWIVLKYLANIRWQNDHNCSYLALREPLTLTSSIVYKKIMIILKMYVYNLSFFFNRRVYVRESIFLVALVKVPQFFPSVLFFFF